MNLNKRNSKTLKHTTLNSQGCIWLEVGSSCIMKQSLPKKKKNQSRSECFVCTDKQVCKDSPLIKHLNVYFDIFFFFLSQTAVLGYGGKDQSKTYVHISASHQSTVPPAQPWSLVCLRVLWPGRSKNVRYLRLSCIPTGTNTSHPRRPLILQRESAADNSQRPSPQQMPCQLSQQSPADTHPPQQEETSGGFRDNWSWLGHNLIYTKPPKS